MNVVPWEECFLVSITIGVLLWLQSCGYVLIQIDWSPPCYDAACVAGP